MLRAITAVPKIGKRVHQLPLSPVTILCFVLIVLFYFIFFNRKQPQPIGTERARKILNPAVSDWMLNSDRSMAGLRWPTNTMDRYSAMQRNQMYLDETHLMDSFQVSLNYFSTLECLLQN